MKRRAFISLLGGAAAWPFAARAQQAAMPVIGYLSARSPDDTTHLVAAFNKGLGETGFIDGRNVTIDWSWGRGQYEQLPAMAAAFVRRGVALIVATGGEPAALAAKAATSTIPIVFSIGGDPVSQGLAASFSHPGGNTTGFTLLTNQLEPKRLGLLRQFLPQAAIIGFLVNPGFPPSERQLADAQTAARAMGLQIHVLRADADGDIDAAFETITRERIAAVLVAAAPFFDTRRGKLVALAARHAVPAMYHFREFADAGGLVSYGIDPADVYRQVGVYAGRVLKGAKPADLPVMQATKFEFVINLKTARALGLEVPLGLTAAADEVIE
jgi:putative tryptophan/tyrosine transport system substrate-binding protein